jgi:hypothetical protein
MVIAFTPQDSDGEYYEYCNDGCWLPVTVMPATLQSKVDEALHIVCRGTAQIGAATFL